MHISSTNWIPDCVFFVCQGIILPQMYTAAAANIFNLGANYVLIFSLQLGVMYVCHTVSPHLFIFDRLCVA